MTKRTQHSYQSILALGFAPGHGPRNAAHLDHRWTAHKIKAKTENNQTNCNPTKVKESKQIKTTSKTQR